ncbi:MAG: LysM peptidoglycan-binding domain-containing protein [Rhodoferax sp.]|uniref:LysM peptidoglycan-binding domain-containing protein n=1 Tax=Rhodoferax sp. TaxID=50421 RepID=UPI0017C16EAD|nr:LysM peptidoglycan-binding domain-containing protein [Rhodoferax sp.]NMM19521.1 LysM peptidoglycan-binding domain-containing protein [Rhodoferax sp.]
MTQNMIVKSKVASQATLAALTVLASVWMPSLAWAQNLPVTADQKATATQVAQAGVPLSELSANAPDNYTIKRGDTLWAISGLFLKSAWRWPELWGMNLNEIKNPHLIYPGQMLYLEKKDGRATLRTRQSANGEAPLETVRLSPRTRYESLASDALPTLKSHLIEPFLAEPMIVDENGLTSAARIVATQEGRVLLTRGDRAYARGQGAAALVDEAGQKQKAYRVFRNATPLKDPVTAEVLGYEAQYVGKALLARGESTQESTGKDGKPRTDIVPATIDIVAAKEEMRVGDRMLPEPERQFLSYVPHAPLEKVDARIVSVYGSAVVNAAQNQVVAINRGTRDGVENGHVLAILKDGARLIDKTDDARTALKLPDERNGLLMVFRTFERLSYALVLEIKDGAKVGDRLVNPR